MLFPTVQSTASELYKREENEQEHTSNLRNLWMVSLWLDPLHAEGSSAICPIEGFMQQTHETTYYQM